MSYSLLSMSHPKARKEHRCIWCGQKILVGEQYTHESSVFDGEMQNHHWHPECWEDSQTNFFRHGEEEFSPYENKRPITNDPHCHNYKAEIEHNDH